MSIGFGEALSIGSGFSISWLPVSFGTFVGISLVWLMTYPAESPNVSVARILLISFVVVAEVVGPLLAHLQPMSFSNHYALRYDSHIDYVVGQHG